MNKFKQENIFSLKNKNILILGGMGLIGLNFADSLSAFGAKVFILDIKKSPNFKKSNNISYIKCDVTSESSLNKAFSEILKKKIKIHTLIYNVYSKPKDYYKKFENYKYKTWNEVVKANLSGAFLSSQIAIKYFKKENIVQLFNWLMVIQEEEMRYFQEHNPSNHSNSKKRNRINR